MKLIKNHSNIYLIIFLAATSFVFAQNVNEKPNIIFIFADDMGYGDVSGLNANSKIQTPNLDRIIDGGIHFTDAHTSSSVCTPSRYSLLTGRYSWRSRLKGGVLRGFSTHLIDPERKTVANVLKDAGYNTACIGKWHLGMDLPTSDGKPIEEKKHETPDNINWTEEIKNGPNENGFDYFYGISASLDMPPYIYIENNRFIGQPTVTKGFPRKGVAHKDFEAIETMGVITDKTIDYIEKQDKRKPFFVYMSLTAPHTPIVPSKRFQGQSEVGLYGDFCMEVDWTVGQVLDALKRKGIADNTLVLFSADNGCSKAALNKNFSNNMLLTPQTKGSTAHHPSYIFRGSKADIWEGGHRVPLLALWPDKIKAGSKSDEIVCLTDFMETAAHMVDSKIPENAGEDSNSFLPALLGSKVDMSKRSGIVNHTISGRFAIRKGKWKLAYCPGSGGWTSPNDREAIQQGLPRIQLYNLEKDPSEENNIYESHPELVKEMKDLLLDYVHSGASVIDKKSENDTKAWSQLKYIK